MFRNKHFNAIITKFFLIVSVFGILLPPAAGITTSTAVAAAVAVTLVSYVIADLMILPRYGNRIAVAADVVLALLISSEAAWVLEDAGITPVAMTLAVLLIGLGEWYYHKYLARLIFKGRLKP
jgi:uncharacterized membrane protein